MKASVRSKISSDYATVVPRRAKLYNRTEYVPGAIGQTGAKRKRSRTRHSMNSAREFSVRPPRGAGGKRSVTQETKAPPRRTLAAAFAIRAASADSFDYSLQFPIHVPASCPQIAPAHVCANLRRFFSDPSAEKVARPGARAQVLCLRSRTMRVATDDRSLARRGRLMQ